MQGKSKHGRGKHPHHLKKSKVRQHHGATGSQPAAVAGITQPPAVASTPVPTGLPTPPAKLRAASNPYFTMELRRIGILTAIILVILIVLSRVLS